MNTSNQGLVRILKGLLRLTLVGIGLSVGFWLILGSSMGAAYLPEVWAGQLDFWIRMAMLVIGGMTIVVSLAYLLSPLGKRLWRLDWLEREADDSKTDSVIKIMVRIVMAGVIIVLGYVFAFAATMGPAITESMAGGVDWGIRISLIGIGFSSIIFALIWLVWPLIRYSWRMLRALKRT